MYRTLFCNDIRDEHIGKTVELAGWVDVVRDHGGVIFVDLRDYTGVTQVVIHNEELLKNVNRETVITVSGVVNKRDPDTVNDKIETGNVELIAEDIDAFKKIEPLEQVIDRIKRKIKAGHITRLRQGDCTMELGFVLSDILTNYERVSDHCSNIAVCFIEMAHDSFETHEYLNSIKTGGAKEFSEAYDMYKQKYYIQ